MSLLGIRKGVRRSERYVNGKQVAEQEMPTMHIGTYSLAETFDIGLDSCTWVSRIYEGSFPFFGELGRVTITLTDGLRR